MKRLGDARSAYDALFAGFRSPPADARPRVWWHWLNGNVTEDGIRLDLEWLERIGIGGVTHIDAAFDWGTPFDTPRLVESPIAYLTPEWRRTLRNSVELASRMGLEFAIASSAGWSESGGPWVTAQQAMKKLVWSETRVPGGMCFKQCLAQPPAAAGPFQGILIAEFGAGGRGERPPPYYRDVATLAYRAPATDVPFSTLEPSITSSAGALPDAARLFDGDLSTAVRLPLGNGPQSWIQFSFDGPQRIQGLSIALRRPLSSDPLRESDAGGWLECSDDGKRFRRIAELPKSPPMRSSALQQTLAFAPTVARVFRVVLERPDSRGPARKLGLAAEPMGHEIAQLVLHTAARVHRFEDKAGFSTRQLGPDDDTPAVVAADVIPQRDVVDLTGYLRADGVLDWTPPPGHWVVLRFGCSLTGRTNFSASPAGRGLEVDKLNRRHVKAYIERHLAEYERALGAAGLFGAQGLSCVLTDSYECGPQNWTDDLCDQFKRRRGYDPLTWLPVLAGRVLESAEASDGFLWDFRKTLGELIADAHYGQISDSLHERGLARYGESHERFRAFIGDGMEVKKTADIPMGAIWAAAPPEFTLECSDVDLRESASVAHIYGKPLVAGESFTTFGNSYGFAPEHLKPFADRALAQGLNRFVLANSVHQPDSQPGPGLALGPFGQWFTRKETWAPHAASWVEYLSRSSYLMQQGRFVADIAWLYGEDTNVTALFHAGPVPVPEGYNFDFVSPDALLSEFSVKGNKLVTRAGMEYRVLALDASAQRMSLPILRKIRDLVAAGAVVVGARPLCTPSFADDPREFATLAAQLWPAESGESVVGAGKMFSEVSLAHALDAMQIPPDVCFDRTADTVLRFVHRALDDCDIYFISNGTEQRRVVQARFRVIGRLPQLWRADTGRVAPLSYSMEPGATRVQLVLDAHDAVFVVFGREVAQLGAVIPEPVIETLAVLEGPWDLSFAAGLGAPAHTRFESLRSWSQSETPGVKYFSGTATYEKIVNVRPQWLAHGARIRIELGVVKNVAEVFLNGHCAGVLWKAPFEVDLTDHVRAGENRLRIAVTNLWPNRLIGDKQPGARRVASAAYDPFTAGSPLLPSGLLGPVTLVRARAR